MNWIKQNLVLVAGIVLPVFLVIGFLVLQGAPKVLADPPEYDFLLVGYRYDAQHPRDYQLSFEVRDGRLEGRATPAGEGNNYPNRQHAAIFRYEADLGSFTEVTWDLPEGLDDLEESVTFSVDEVAGLRLDKSMRSPDGYVFEYAGYRGRGGLLGEIFGMGRRHDSNYVLQRNGATFNLPSPASTPYYYGHQLHLLGWILEEDGSS